MALMGSGAWLSGLLAAVGYKFTTIQPDSGTSPTADSLSDTLTLTSTTLRIIGDSATDTITIQLHDHLYSDATNDRFGINGAPVVPLDVYAPAGWTDSTAQVNGPSDGAAPGEFRISEGVQGNSFLLGIQSANQTNGFTDAGSAAYFSTGGNNSPFGIFASGDIAHYIGRAAQGSFTGPSTAIGNNAPRGPFDVRFAAASIGLVSLSAQPADGNWVEITDADGTVKRFEFDNNASVTGGNVAVTIGADVNGTIENLQAAVEANLDTLARADGAYLALKQRAIGAVGDNTITKSGANITVTGFQGGFGPNGSADFYLDGDTGTLYNAGGGSFITSSGTCVLTVDCGAGQAAYVNIGSVGNNNFAGMQMFGSNDGNYAWEVSVAGSLDYFYNNLAFTYQTTGTVPLSINGVGGEGSRGQVLIGYDASDPANFEPSPYTLRVNGTSTLGGETWITLLNISGRGTNEVLYSLNGDGTVSSEAAFTYDAGTNTLDVDKVNVDDNAYGSGWNGSTLVPTRNAVYDKIESLNLFSGTYTPTLTNVANLDASTAYQCQYLRVGNTVTVSGKVDVDPTLTATSTQLGVSLPIASNLGAVEDLGGVAFASGVAAQGAAILGDATNNRAQMQWIAGDVTNQAMYFTFTYEVI